MLFLSCRWNLWYYKNDRQKSWLDNLKKVGGFDTAEDFWALFNHMCRPSGLAGGCDYSLFKDGLQPTWEDRENSDGGCWRIVLEKCQRATALDRYWVELALLMIGEGFDEACAEICGVVVNVRQKGDRLSLWMRDNNSDRVMAVGRTLKCHLQLQVRISYFSHADEARKMRSTAKPLHQL